MWHYIVQVQTEPKGKWLMPIQGYMSRDEAITMASNGRRPGDRVRTRQRYADTSLRKP